MELFCVRGNWYHIAKAEFLVLTSRFRKHRKSASIVVLIICAVWALLIVPIIMSLVIEWYGEGFDLVLILSFPGFMRSLIMSLWVMLIVFPITNALSEIKISQWEIMLSNNVSTRDMMIGTFVGSIPIYGIAVLVFGPVIISPFVLVYEVSLAGQIFIYLALFCVATSALWFSTLLCTALQARLGNSPRGNDIAKALVMVLAIVVLVPMYGLIFFGASIVQVMGLDIFKVFPFTWGADLIIWLVILFNGISLSPSHIAAVESMLGFNLLTNMMLLLSFSVGMVGLAIVSADRLFSIGAGARTEQVITVRRENAVLRSIRRLSPSPSGVLLVTAMKDFGRKTQNMSKLAYGMVMAVVLPLMMRIGLTGFTDPVGLLVVSALIVGTMLSLAGGMAFGGIGFLDSKDQLWILKSAPSGVEKFVKARITESMIFALPMAAISTLIVSYIVGLGVIESIIVLTNACLSLYGAIMIATGITANNPNYEDTKSKAFKGNTGGTMITIMIIMQVTLLLLIETGLRNPLLMIFAPSIVMSLVGSVFTVVGTRRLARPE
jgi:hypothetical protein